MELYKKRISDLGRIVTGKTPRTSNAENYGGKIPFLTPSDDLSGKFAPKTVKTITELGLSEVRNCLLPSKSVCVSCIGSDLGKVVITNEPTVSNQQFNSIIPTEENDTDFIYYLMTIVGKELNFLSKTSTAVPIINKSTFADYEIEIPSLENQRRIAKVLSSLDDKIEVNRRINDNLEQRGQALFEEYVMNLNKPRTQLLSDYALINPARTIAKGRAARCIEMSSLPTKGTFPSDWTFKEYNGGMKFRNGDTIMARITPCLENGKTAYINFLDENEVAFGSTEYIVLSAHEGFCSELLYFLARYDDFVSYAVSHMNGSSGRQRVSGNDIANYVMPEISNETMDVVSEKLHGIMEVIKNNSLESRRLAEIRDALLPRLMSGDFKLEEVNM
ncbi:MAG: hypothetical protein E7107_16015 [Prevotella sp.]|jgi:type I restriction enzyme S subunit|nr:hypothetical protein [Prevotella sp.]